MSREKRPAPIGWSQDQLMPIQVRDQWFPNVGAAAKHFKVSKNVIYQRLHRGTIDNLGLPNVKGPGRPPIPVKIGPFEAPSQMAGSRMLGKGVTFIRDCLRGGEEGKQRLLAAVMKWQMKQNKTP